MKTIARVAKLTAPYQIVFEEEPLDFSTLGDLDIAAVTEWSAISPGTEIAAYTGAPPLRSDIPAYPRLVGYCNVARVVAVGKNITNIASGDRIVTYQPHRSHFVVDLSSVITVVPENLDSRLAAVTYLFHLGYDALMKGGAIAGTNAIVIGLGALGLGAVAVANMAGVRVAAVSSQAVQYQRAMRMGAAVTLNRDYSPDELSRFGGDSGIDLAVVTTNSWDDYLLALNAVRQGGVICLLGFPGRLSGVPTFNPLEAELFYRKQLTIRAVGMAPTSDVPASEIRFTDKRNMSYLIERIAAGILPAEELISAEYDADRLKDAYDDLVERRKNPITYLLRWPAAEELR